jgi:hypothetical protein
VVDKPLLVKVDQANDLGMPRLRGHGKRCTSSGSVTVSLEMAVVERRPPRSSSEGAIPAALCQGEECKEEGDGRPVATFRLFPDNEEVGAVLPPRPDKRDGPVEKLDGNDLKNFRIKIVHYIRLMFGIGVLQMAMRPIQGKLSGVTRSFRSTLFLLARLLPNYRFGHVRSVFVDGLVPLH